MGSSGELRALFIVGFIFVPVFVTAITSSAVAQNLNSCASGDFAIMEMGSLKFWNALFVFVTIRKCIQEKLAPVGGSEYGPCQLLESLESFEREIFLKGHRTGVYCLLVMIGLKITTPRARHYNTLVKCKLVTCTFEKLCLFQTYKFPSPSLKCPPLLFVRWFMVILMGLKDTAHQQLIGTCVHINLRLARSHN